MNKQEHWENIYRTKDSTNVSWFRPHLDSSLRLIESINLDFHACIIDVGCGSSTLVDDLLDRGFTNLTCIDISAEALKPTKDRLGKRVANVSWLTGDVTQFALPENAYDLWHDRAVFHFLTDPKDRASYLENLDTALRPEGHVIIATFADDGPEKCSGLVVERYDLEKMRETIGERFELIESFREQHHTPFNTTQNFLYAHFRKAPEITR